MITVVCPDLSTNAFGRALVLADAARLSGRDVSIVGRMSSGQIWPPGQIADVPFVPLVGGPAEQRILLREVARSSEVLWVSKPKAPSLGLVLSLPELWTRMLIDIDDWEMGFMLDDSGGWPHLVPRLLRRFGANSATFTLLADAALRRSGAKTVSNSWLKSRFGGSLIYHSRVHQSAFDPSPRNGPGLVVGFCGTVRPHKGVQILVDAIEQMNPLERPRLRLLGIGKSHYEKSLIADAKAKLGAHVETIGTFPQAHLGKHLAELDIIVVPSLQSDSSRGQIPAKLFDGLAAGRAVISTDVNDAANIVGDAGIVVPSGDVSALSAAISRVSRDTAFRLSLGRAARERFVERYSASRNAEVLTSLLRH